MIWTKTVLFHLPDRPVLFLRLTNSVDHLLAKNAQAVTTLVITMQGHSG